MRNTETFSSGEPCKNGHVSERFVASKKCVECARSPERRLRNIISARTSARKNPKATTERIKRWRVANHERVLGYNVRYRERNAERGRIESRRDRKKQDPLHRRAWEGARRARQIRATPEWADMAAIKRFYLGCPEGHHVDHIVPLRSRLVCGLHVPCNLQYLTAEENCRKRNKFAVKVTA